MAACAAFFGSWFVAFRDAEVKIQAIHFFDDVAVEEGAFTGTQDGVFSARVADVLPTGRLVRADYIQVPFSRRQACLIRFDDRLSLKKRSRGRRAPSGAALAWRRLFAIGTVQPRLENTIMLVYDFEVLKGETVVASKRSIALPNVSAAWTKIANLAKAIDEPGYKIRVRDQAGGIVILIGVAALRCCADAISRRHFEGSWRVGSSLSSRQPERSTAAFSRVAPQRPASPSSPCAPRRGRRHTFAPKSAEPRDRCFTSSVHYAPEIFIAMRTKSARLRAPMRSITHDRWLSTVLGLILSRMPISLLESPATASSMTWRCRGESTLNRD